MILKNGFFRGCQEVFLSLNEWKKNGFEKFCSDIATRSGKECKILLTVGGSFKKLSLFHV